MEVKKKPRQLPRFLLLQVTCYSWVFFCMVTSFLVTVTLPFSWPSLLFMLTPSLPILTDVPSGSDGGAVVVVVVVVVLEVDSTCGSGAGAGAGFSTGGGGGGGGGGATSLSLHDAISISAKPASIITFFIIVYFYVVISYIKVGYYKIRFT
jgi:hypothetical protein